MRFAARSRGEARRWVRLLEVGVPATRTLRLLAVMQHHQAWRWATAAGWSTSARTSGATERVTRIGREAGLYTMRGGGLRIELLDTVRGRAVARSCWWPASAFSALGIPLRMSRRPARVCHLPICIPASSLPSISGTRVPRTLDRQARRRERSRPPGGPHLDDLGWSKPPLGAHRARSRAVSARIRPCSPAMKLRSSSGVARRPRCSASVGGSSGVGVSPSSATASHRSASVIPSTWRAAATTSWGVGTDRVRRFRPR